MARVTSKRIECTALQGDGSYMVIRPVGWKEAKEARKFMMVGDVDNSSMSEAQKEEHISKETELTESILFAAVVEWNWADENNQPIPVPRKSEDLDLLTAEEVSFIMKHALGLPEEKAKN